MKKNEWKHAHGWTFPRAVNFFRMMKLTLFLILLSLSGAMASKSYSQNTKLSLDFRNTTIKSVLGEIENKSNFFFLYSEKVIDVNRKVSINVIETGIEKILDLLFQDTEVSYTVKGRQIVLTSPDATNSLWRSQVGQQRTITGKVTDASGQPLPGVTVVVKGTIQGTVTDRDGNYSLSNVPGDGILVFSFVGMKTQEIVVAGKTSINVVMTEDVIGIEEVVAIGYGTQSEKTLTGSIASVDVNQLESAPILNAVQALQGRASGITVIQNNGKPGSEFKVQIRGVGTIGNTDPLYVIDGIVGAGSNNFINPNDIESIDILKDASAAAIYGSRAANGVVLITTKRGKSGIKPTINIDSYFGIQNVWKTVDVLNARQYAEYSNEMMANGGKPLVPALADPSALKDVTNWQNEIFRPAVIQDHNFSFSGGNDAGRYLFSAGYYSQDGIIINTGFDRFSFRANSDFNLGKKLKIGESFLISTTGSLENNGGVALVHTIYFPPYIPVYDPTEIGGYDGPDVRDGTDAQNPVRLMMLPDATSKRIGVLGNAYLSYEIIKGLEYKFSASINYDTSKSYYYGPAYTSGERSFNLYASLSEGFSHGNNMLLENTLNYRKSIGKHSFSALAGYTRQWYEGRGFYASKRTFPTNDLRVMDAGQEMMSISGSENEWSLVSLLGRITYNYDSRYLLTANIRRDGSSRFADGHQYGVYPSFSVGWILSEEPFLKNSPVISNLKLKYGWGQLGMQEIGNYAYQATLTNTIKYVLGTTQVPVSAITSRTLANRDISWESTTASNIGLDLGLFDNSLTTSLEYWIRHTNDMLIPVPLPVSSGIMSDPTLNAGAVDNKGLDFDLGYKKRINDFNFSINANVSYLISNKVTSLGDRTQPLFGAVNYARSVVGEPIGHYFGFMVDRIYQGQAEIDADNALPKPTGVKVYQSANTKPGDIRFKDLSGDGRINADDRAIIGNPVPKWNYGLTITAGYKNFDFSMMFQGMSGFDIVNRIRILYTESMIRSMNSYSTVLNRWTPTNPSTTMPRAVANDPNGNARFSDRWIEDGSYVRLKLMTIGYQVPDVLLNKIAKGVISSVRVYATGNNLLTFANNSLWDPEGTGNDNMYRGVILYDNFPQARAFMFGIQAGF